MAEIIPALILYYMNSTAIKTAFGNRIWGNKIPDLPGGGAQPYPYARMREISNAQNYSHGGYAGRRSLVQIDVYDADETNANTNSELLRAALDGYKGMIGGVDAGMVKARRGTGSWDPTVRNYWRILEVEVMTND